MKTAPEYARLLRQYAELVNGEFARIMRETADELERLHEIEHRGSGGQTGATTTGEPVVLWSRTEGGGE